MKIQVKNKSDRFKTIKLKKKPMSKGLTVVEKSLKQIEIEKEQALVARLELDLLGQVDIRLGQDESNIWWQLAEMYVLNEKHRNYEIPVTQAFTSEFYTYIQICRGQLANGRTTFVRPFSPIDYYWPRPDALCYEEETCARREYMTGRIMHFIHSSVERNREKGVEINPASESYRKTLAAQELTMAIELYSENYKHENDNDDDLIGKCKYWASEYIKAMCPIPAMERINGPKDMIDPDYLTYRRICTIWGIPNGTILHRYYASLEQA